MDVFLEMVSYSPRKKTWLYKTTDITAGQPILPNLPLSKK